MSMPAPIWKDEARALGRTAVGFPLQCGQPVDGVLAPVERYEEVVVMGGRDHVATDPGVRQDTGDGGGQADGLQVGLNVEGDPGSAEEDR